MKRYLVYGWLYSDNYDAAKPADWSVRVSAHNEAEAEDKGEKQIQKEFDKCDVIVVQCIDNGVLTTKFR